MHCHALLACGRGFAVTGRGSRGGATAQGRVTETLPNAMYRVQLDSGHEIVAHVSGQQRLALVRILPGDRVNVEVSPLDTTRGRIVARLTASAGQQ
jgi:translation initiation factor IF-1